MVTPERSVEEIVEEFAEDQEVYEDAGCTQKYIDRLNWLTQTLTTERQKREEVVEAERARCIEIVKSKRKGEFNYTLDIIMKI